MLLITLMFSLLLFCSLFEMSLVQSVNRSLDGTMRELKSLHSIIKLVSMCLREDSSSKRT